MEIGEKLKEAREKKGLSLESLQETTKIQKRYLEAIEEGNFQILPGTFYARAFIREYALAVGLNPAELLEEHQNEVPSADSESTVQYTRMQRTNRENRRERSPVNFSFIPTLIVVLLVIAIFFAGWLFLRKSTSTDNVDPVEEQSEDEIFYNEDGDQKDNTNNEEEQANDAKEEEETASEDEEESDVAEPEFTVVEKGTGSSPESELDLNHLPDDVTVELEATSDSYLEITGESGETYFSGMVTADQSLEDIDISDETNIRFNVGNAPALNIKMNGTDLEYPVDPDTTVHQKILVNLNKESE